MSKTQHNSKNKRSEASKKSKAEEVFLLAGKYNILDEDFISMMLDHRKPNEKYCGFSFSKDDGNENKRSGIKDFVFISTDPIINLGPKKQPLQVMFSSTEQDNEQLLHFLFNKSRA